MTALKWLDQHFEECICYTCLTVLAVSVFAQVLARYVFNVGLYWTQDIAAICMVWCVYIGASLCVRERFHIRILFAVTALPTGLGKITILVADLFWAVFCLLMLRSSWDYLALFLRFPEINPGLGINNFYPQTILLVGYALMLIRLSQTYVKWWQTGGSGLPGLLAEEHVAAAVENGHKT